MKKRIILLHCHIFKNAGSTIDETLKVNFNNSASFIESRDGQFIPNEKIISTCLADKNIVSLSSHKIRVPSPCHPDLHFIPLVMLRNPLDRLGSMYNFYRGQNSSILQHEYKLAQRLPFRDFVQVLLESGNDSSFANLQTQFFLGQGLGLSEETWPMAVVNFHEAACVGVVEKFDESMVLWSKYLAQYFAGIDFSYQKMNVSVDRAATMESRISVLEEALGEELLGIFRKRNQYDYQLYGLALDRVERELHGLGDCCAEIATSCRFNKTPVVGHEANIDDCQVKAVKAPTADTDSATGPPLCVDKEGMQVIIPRVCRNNEVLEQGAVIIGCGLFDANNQPIYIAKQGQNVMVLLAVSSFQVIENPITGITVKDHSGKTILAMNSSFSSNKLETIPKNSTNVYCFQFVMPPLNQGSYSITPAIAYGTQEHHHVLDAVDDAVIFFIPAMINPRMPGVLYLQDFKFSISDGQCRTEVVPRILRQADGHDIS